MVLLMMRKIYPCEEVNVVQTRSKGPPASTSTPSPTISSKKTLPQDKPIVRTLVISDQLDYDLVEDMKRTRENIYFYELTKLKQQRNNFT
jgi:predicted AAA+ superfamily ATPase